MTGFRQCIRSNQGDVRATLNIAAHGHQMHTYEMEVEVLRNLHYCESDGVAPIFSHKCTGIRLDEDQYKQLRKFFEVVEEGIICVHTDFGFVSFEVGPKDELIIETGKFGFAITIDAGPLHSLKMLTTIDPTSFGSDHAT